MPATATVSTALPPRERGVSPAFLASCTQLPAWARDAASAPDGDVVLSSRARLARNLLAYPFPPRASDDDLRRVAQEVRRAALADTERLGELTPVEVGALSTRERGELLTARRISPELAQGLGHRWALLDPTARLSIWVNEEDHIRIASVEAGSALLTALHSAEDADCRLARRLTFARNAELGYLTSALTNVGTGLRVSSLLHLPALRFLGRLGETLHAANRLGISIRGAHGEHSRASGDLYQVSNAITWGLTPSQIAGRVRPVVEYLVASERQARHDVGHTRRDKAIERAVEAVRRIDQAPQLGASDALNLLSSLRLAATLPATAPQGSLPPLPGTATFARLIAELHDANEICDLPTSDGANVRDAIGRPARLRMGLRSATPSSTASKF